jgi:hypothetical protein
LLRFDDGAMCSVPPQWTDVVALDPEILMEQSRALFRVADLMELGRVPPSGTYGLTQVKHSVIVIMYGVSRPTFYQAKADFEEAGIAGLVPKRRGPRGPHKLQSEVLAFLKKRLVPGEPIRARELARLVQNEFGLEVHPRTIERAVGAKKTLR